jgi:hypothetical protein
MHSQGLPGMVAFTQISADPYFDYTKSLTRKALIVSKTAEPHHFYMASAPAPNEDFDAVPVLASTSTLLYIASKLFSNKTFQKSLCYLLISRTVFNIETVANVNGKSKKLS